MAEYIDREMAINLFYTVDPENDGTDGSTEIRKTANYSSEEIESMLSDLPPANVVSVRHAQWVDRYGGKYSNHLYECSACKGKGVWGGGDEHLDGWRLTAFCPHCGAKMDGGIGNGL